MELLNKVLYWVSTGLMLPVVVALVFLFLRALLYVGEFYGQYSSRKKTHALIKNTVDELMEKGSHNLSLPESKDFLINQIQRLTITRSAVHIEKIFADTELAMTKQLAAAKRMAKLGPVLGLMGTLIPMGPALVGLAAGDIASMAENMQVAFSTTVVGLVVGAIGFILVEVKQRWFAQDMAELHFIGDFILEENEKKKS